VRTLLVYLAVYSFLACCSSTEESPPVKAPVEEELSGSMDFRTVTVEIADRSFVPPIVRCLETDRAYCSLKFICNQKTCTIREGSAGIVVADLVSGEEILYSRLLQGPAKYLFYLENEALNNSGLQIEVGYESAHMRQRLCCAQQK